jgi:hypothetical protein
LWAEITCETNDARVRDDGTDPTSGVGELHKVTMTLPLVYFGPVSKLRVISTAAGGSTLSVLFYAARSKQQATAARSESPKIDSAAVGRSLGGGSGSRG